jgi:hypothetical protein
MGGLPRTDVLGYSQPSLRDWSLSALVAVLFLASAVQISGSKKANLVKTGEIAQA